MLSNIINGKIKTYTTQKTKLGIKETLTKDTLIKNIFYLEIIFYQN